jgi:FKBP-type peptidyl-prolyl cis-trans isomerase
MKNILPLLLALSVYACNESSKKSVPAANDSITTRSNIDTTKEVITSSGLKYTILKRGTGPAAKAGEEVLIHETLSYMNDSLLFDSRKLASPVKVLVGGHQAIEGVDEGLRGMQKGELRKLIVPPALSKRSGVQTFPHPDSALIYVIELMEILPAKN